MSTQGLPGIRRVVAAHNDKGALIVESDQVLEGKDIVIVPGAKVSAVWATTDGLPTNDNNEHVDGASRKLDADYNFGMIPALGSNCQVTELSPGVLTPMHRTSSLDFNILIEGEVVYILEDGSETLIKNPGDIMISKGGMHAWRNPSDTKPVRWVTVLIDAKPVVVDGKALEPVFDI